MRFDSPVQIRQLEKQIQETVVTGQTVNLVPEGGGDGKKKISITQE